MRRLLLPLVSVLVPLTLLAAVPGGRADAAGQHVRLWAGYRIPGDGHADGGWIGGRTLTGDGARHRVYRLQPRASSADATYAPARSTSHWPGASAREVQRAAWTLAKYGSYNGDGRDVQAAAVDAVVTDLLTGGRFAVTGRTGAARIAHSGSPGYVRSYVRTILRDSARYAGPYRVSVHAPRVPAGSAGAVRVAVRTVHGHRPVPGLAVTVAYHGREHRVVTGRHGTASADVTARPGSHRVTATVGVVPDWRLWVARSRVPGASDVALADHRVRLHGAAQVVGVRTPTLSIVNDAPVVTRGSRLTGHYRVSGGSGSRTVTIRLYGPADTASTGCTGPPLMTSGTPIDHDGSYALPVTDPTSRSGFYRWSVSIARNDVSAATSACGDPVRVQSPATLAEERAGSRTAAGYGEPFGAGAQVGGFDRSETHTLTARLYGPFTSKSAVSCREGKAVPGRSVTKTITSDGDYTMPTVTVGSTQGPGWYAWKTSLSNGPLVAGASTGCGVVTHVTG